MPVFRTDFGETESRVQRDTDISNTLVFLNKTTKPSVIYILNDGKEPRVGDTAITHSKHYPENVLFFSLL